LTKPGFAFEVRIEPVTLPAAGRAPFSLAAKCAVRLSLLVNVYAPVEMFTVAIVLTVAATVKALAANAGTADTVTRAAEHSAARAVLRST